MILFLGCTTVPKTDDTHVSLDRAINIAVENIEQGIGFASLDASAYADSAEREMQSGQTDFDSFRQRAQGFTQRPVIAVLNFNSVSNALSAYILEELTLAMAKSNRFIVVDRQSLDIIRQEENFQLSGEVSDETAQAIGKKLGAQYVVTGSLQEMGNYYRFRVIALNVETAAINAPTSININRNDPQIGYFISSNQPVPIPKPPSEPITANPVFNFGLGIGGGQNVGFDIELLCFQAGLNLGRLEILLEAIGGPNIIVASDDAGFGYHLGGLIEYSFFDVAVLGLGGGFGGSAIYTKKGAKSFSYPYIRGSASFRFDEIGKLGAFYDYCFDYGSRFGIRIIMEVTRLFWS